MAAKFLGIVDVPLFQRPGNLNLSSYVGFDANPVFAPHCRTPMFSYQPQTSALDNNHFGRIASIMPTLNGDSEVLMNPTTVPGFAGMSFRANYIDGMVYCLDEGLTTGGGTNYTWNLWRFAQNRRAGQTVLGQPPRWFIDANHPASFPPRSRIEFQLPPLPARDVFGLSNYPTMPFTWNNGYNRMYAFVHTPYGIQARNLFTALYLPGATWLNFTSGSSLAFCRNAYANSFSFGFDRQPFFGGGFGIGFDNYLFVSAGAKDAPWVVSFKTHEYNPDNIDGQTPRAAPVALDDAEYNDALINNLARAQGWKDGFILTLNMNGQGMTGQHQEVVVTDPLFSYWYVLRFVPQVSTAAQALIPTNVNWSVHIDTEGTVWFYNGGSPGFKDIIFNSYSPALFFNPRLIDFDLPSITMPCYNTCLPGYI